MGPANARPARRPRHDARALAELFHALSDETRIALLGRLRGGERCVCELVDFLAAGQSRLSFHLKTLKEAGLVHDRRDGRWVHYSLDPEAFELMVDYLDSFRAGDKGGNRGKRGDREVAASLTLRVLREGN